MCRDPAEVLAIPRYVQLLLQIDGEKVEREAGGGWVRQVVS